MKSAIDDRGRRRSRSCTKLDPDGKPAKVPRNAVPCVHSVCHTAAFADGERIEDVAWLVRHASASTTRAVYLHEIRDAEANASRRARMAAWDGSEAPQAAEPPTTEGVDFGIARHTATDRVPRAE